MLLPMLPGVPTTTKAFRCGVLAWGMFASLAMEAAGAEPPILLRDVTRRTGIDFRHTDGSTGKHYIVESVTGGLAVFDYDGDGDCDIYFTNGAPLPNADGEPRPRDALYRNDGQWRFTDVTHQAGVANAGFALGVTAADFDNDGDQDLYVNNFGPNVLYRNNGDGTFTDVSHAARVTNGHKLGASPCFLDIENDGDLDLYVGNYVRFSCDSKVRLSRMGVPLYPGPRWFPAEPDTLYRNDSDGAFTDISAQSGIGRHAGSGMGAVCMDYEEDGDTDIFVCNDCRGNFLYRNDGTGKFEEMALAAGVAFDFDGDTAGSMGAACGDFDNDGLLDLLSTNYQGELPVLYKNMGNGLFVDVTQQTGVGAGTLAHVTWGVGFADFDNDGDRDVFIACGHTQDTIEMVDDATSYYARNVLLMNTGAGRFVDVSATAGDGMAVCLATRGAAFDDLDDDGDIDVVLSNIRREPTILRNDTNSGNHWVQILLRGRQSNRDGVGARVTVVAGGLVQVDEVHSGHGYQSHFGSRLHFGLGKRDRIDRVEVRWPGGRTDLLENVRADQQLTIIERP